MTRTQSGAETIQPSKLAEYLRDAEQAHGVYEREKLHGVRDENWADWYARYITDRMNQDRQR